MINLRAIYNSSTLPNSGLARELTTGTTPRTIEISLKDKPMLLACNVLYGIMVMKPEILKNQCIY